MFRRRHFVFLDPFSRGYVSIFIQTNNIPDVASSIKTKAIGLSERSKYHLSLFYFPFKDLMAANTAPSRPNLSDQFMEVTLFMIKRHKLLYGK